LLAATLLASACKTAAPAPKGPPPIPFEKKMAWILELEDRRILRTDPPPAPPPVEPARRGRAPQVAPAPPPTGDLVTLTTDADPRIRRRAALAIGRVGLAEGVPPLAGLLSDTDSEVKQSAAFALGLIGDTSAAAALAQALTDPAPMVRGRAAEALGLIGAKDSAAAIGALAAEYARHVSVTSRQPDDELAASAAEADAFKLAIFALVRLGAWDPLASAVLDGDRPVTGWWPVAYALQRINDKRALPALRHLVSGPGKYPVAFAVRGLGALKDSSSAAAILPLLDGARPIEVTVAAIRAAGQIGIAEAVEPLGRIAGDSKADPNLRLEAVSALGELKGAEALPIIQDLITHPWPVMRIAALRASASIDQESFVVILASLDQDPQWSVRSALAGVLATLPEDIAADRLRAMLADGDKRVVPAVLRALVRLKVPDAPELLLARVKDLDFSVRAAVSELIGQVKPQGGAEALREAYKTASPDLSYSARTAAIEALASYGAAEASETLRAALADGEWAVRVRAAELLDKLDPTGGHRRVMRPVPGPSSAPYDDKTLIAPDYSPHVFIDTAKGSIEFELAVLDAPQTSRNFVALARKGFFNGLAIHRVVPNFVVQDGDSRGDGTGGPGYTIRDELNERPFLRGTVGMALSWKDTGGSQFFITHSPQPHLDAKYTVFGHVVNGMEVVDRIQQGDVIQRVRVWDGRGWQ
jgi:cyclophilin family peptidyl-prolyl cis-trans isomerase/HEAT repeat protein